jgi:hypothetical protein
MPSAAVVARCPPPSLVVASPPSSQPLAVAVFVVIVAVAAPIAAAVSIIAAVTALPPPTPPPPPPPTHYLVDSCRCVTAFVFAAVKATAHHRYGASQCGSLNNALNPTLGLKNSFFKGGKVILHTCLHTTSDDDQTRWHKKHKSPTKHHHHGGGAARPSSGVDLINPCRLRGGRPCACSLRCRRQSD